MNILGGGGRFPGVVLNGNFKKSSFCTDLLPNTDPSDPPSYAPSDITDYLS